MNEPKTYPLFFFLCLLFLSVHTAAQKPVLTSFTPTKGPVGSTVTISGSNFSTLTANNTVYFGGVKAIVSGATTGTLRVVVPAGAGYQPLTVTVNGLTAYSLLPFTVTFNSDSTAYTPNSFSTEADSSWGFGVSNVGATDLDGDGDVDPVLVAAGAGFISILKNNSTLGSISLSHTASAKYTTGSAPADVAFGDLNGDGRQDIVVANSGDSTLSVFENNSTADSIRLLPEIRLATGKSPAKLVIRDLNMDGRPDIICTNSGSNTLSVFRNTTTGGVLSFAAKTDFATGNRPYGLLVTDMDGDGEPEVLVANENDFTLSIFINASTPGTISLGNKTDLATAYGSQLAAADFDGDGKTDIAATTGYSPRFSVFRNTSTTGSFSFAPEQQFSAGFGQPTALALADIDGDGKPDVATNHTNYSTVSVVKNLSRPGFISFGTNADFYVGQMPPALLLADLDNDARPDIISVGSGGSALSILQNLIPKPGISSVTPSVGGNGTTVTITGNNFRTTTAVDFGGTPAASFMVLSPTVLTAVVDTGSAGDVSVTTAYGVATFAGFQISKQPTIASFTPTSGGPGTVLTIRGTNLNTTTSVQFGNVAADAFTIVSPTTITATAGSLADGDYELSVTNPSGTATSGSFYTGVTIHSFYPTSGPVGTVVTINGNHFSATPSGNTVYFGSVAATVLSASTTTLTVVVPEGATFHPVSVTVNNLTAFSREPFLVSFNSTGNGFNAASFGNRVDSSAGNYPIYVSVADLDQDGRSDLVTSNFASGTLSVSRNTSHNGLLSFQYKTDYPTTKPKVWSSATGDLDGDGKTDLLAVTGDNTVGLDRSFSVFKNASTADSIILTRTDYPIGIMNSNPRYSLIADFDEDGKPDLAFLSFSGLTILRNTTTNGTISFAPGTSLSPYIASESQIALADVDGDGKADLVIAGDWENVSVFRNTSEPGHISFAREISIPTGTLPRSVSVGDFDNDGKPDLAVLSGGNNTLFIHKNKSTAGVVAFDTRIPFPLNVIPDNLALGDLNGDGKIDLSFVTTRDKYVYVLENTTNTGAISFSGKVAYDAPYTPGHVFIADMNNDGKADLVVNNASDANNFSVLINNLPGAGLPPVLIDALGPTEICEGKKVALKTRSVTGASYQWYQNGNPVESATDSVYTANTAGSYAVKRSTGGTAMTSAPVNVVVKAHPPAPVLTIITGTASLCKGTSALLHSSTPVGVQWYQDNERIDGQTDSVYRVETPGSYKVMALSNGCPSSYSNEITIESDPGPVANITAGATSFCSRDSASLTATAGTANVYQWSLNDEQVPGATSAAFTTKNGGRVSVFVTNSAGCSAKSPGVTITKLPSPAKPTITLAGNNLQSGTPEGNQWYKDGLPITGATAQTFTPVASGNYSVQVTQNGCASVMSDAFSFIVTAVVTIDPSHFIKLSPNPVHTKLNLEFRLNGIYRLNIDLLDLNGRLVKHWQNQNSGSRLYLPDCSGGMYFARISTANGQRLATIKLIRL